MATITSQTYEFVPEIWKQIKDYAGVFPVPTNVANLDKLTFEELEDSLDAYDDVIPQPFGITVYDIMTQNFLHHAGGSKYYYDEKEIKSAEKKEMIVRFLKREYRRSRRYMSHKGKQQYWKEVSDLITYSYEKRAEKKEGARKKRAAAKEHKSTAKGMIAEINKIVAEQKRLRKRMKDDQEKLDKLAIKSNEWRVKLSNKRDENHGRK